MRIASYSLLLVSLLACGCGPTGTSGGPGAKTNGGKTDHTVLGTPSAETFDINVPATSTSIKQGESKAIVLSLKRGTNFDEDVKLKFENVPKGVTIEPAPAMIPKSEREARVTIKAADDAALGDFTIKVTGEPSRGKAATNTLKVKVEKT